MTTTVYEVGRIITMDPARPFATHVAVRDGRILAVGNHNEVTGWGEHDYDARFSDKIMMPGFVEGHAHMMAGGIWRYTYAGYHDRLDPDGGLWKGLQDIDTVILRLREAEAKLAPDVPLVAWGFDPIFLDTERLNRRHLDEVSQTRPIAVIHSNFHLLTANSVALAKAQFSSETNIEGVHMGDDGEPSGELQEFAAMFPVMRRLKIDFGDLARTDQGVVDYGKVANRCGVTTATDLYNDLPDAEVDLIETVTSRDDYPLRVVPKLNASTGTPAEVAARALALRARSTERMRLGGVKVMTDGSIQAFTARIRWPGYYRGPDHGTWNIAPEQLTDLIDTLNREGIHIHIHVNGDEASQVAIEAFQVALARHPNPDHRHVMQHCQMADAAQFRQIKALGLCANLFANHLYYFGDKHYEVTVGPDRAEKLDACGTALRLGVPLAIHSDAPVTPMGPLFTAWCAVNRKTESGRVLGKGECISVEQALRAITVGAAYTLHMDNEVGSIEVGKSADFAILDQDPLTVGADGLKDVTVWGTVLAGRVFPVP